MSNHLIILVAGWFIGAASVALYRWLAEDIDEKEHGAPTRIDNPVVIYRWFDIPFYGKTADDLDLDKEVEDYIAQMRNNKWDLVVAAPSRRWLFRTRIL